MSNVVVIGAGPTGLLAAIGLVRRGVEVKVLDRRSQPDPTTRALSVWGRALDTIEQHGVEREVLEDASVPVRRLVYFNGASHLATFTLPASAPCRTLPQQRTEKLLIKRLGELGVTVDWAHDVVDVEETNSGVELKVRTSNGFELVEGSYVVAADGARSIIRKQLGIGFEGETFERQFAVVDARLDRGTLDSDACLFYQSPTGPLVVVPMGNGIFRFLSGLPNGGIHEIADVVRSRGLDIALGEVVSSAIFTVHAREATKYRLGRVFLAGDAAHIHSPAGGQGMNNGLQDAHNLSWKLASVIVSGAPETILDTYETERRPATRRIIADTSRQMTWWMLESRWKIFVRDFCFRVSAASGLAARWYGPTMAGYGVRYPIASTPSPKHRCRRGREVGQLRGGPLVDGWSITARDVVSVAAAMGHVSSKIEIVGANDECRAGGFSLVRPDGHVQWHGHSGDLYALGEELDWWGIASSGQLDAQAGAISGSTSQR